VNGIRFDRQLYLRHTILTPSFLLPSIREIAGARCRIASRSRSGDG
jgi:hypothetical protein